MAYTLGNLLADTYLQLGQLEVSTATGGSTTTLVDSKMAKTASDDAWKDGFIIVMRDAAGAGAAPEGEYGRISAFAQATGTFTSVFTVAPATGDTYGYASSYFPYPMVIEMANQAIKTLGYVTLVDTTTLDTADDQTEYACAVAWKRPKPIRVDIQGDTGDSDDNKWIPVREWGYVPAAGGSTELIVFGFQPASGLGVRVWYNDIHPSLTAGTSVINEAIYPDLAIAATVERVLAWQNSRVSGADQFLLQRWNDAKNVLATLKIERPMVVLYPRPRILTLREDYGSDNDTYSEPD